MLMQSSLTRLMKDLADIESEPHAVSARPLPNDMFEWHANVVGFEGTPYEGGIFHLCIKFPLNYPSKSPSVSVFTPIPHPHVVGDQICLNLLSNFEFYFAGQNYSDGWSPAYSVSTILLQLQVFITDICTEELSTEQLSNLLKNIPSAVEASKNFTCHECGHTYYEPWPSVNDSYLIDNTLTDSSDIFDDFSPFDELNESLEIDDDTDDDCLIGEHFCNDCDCEYSSSLPNSNTLPYIVSCCSSLPRKIVLPNSNSNKSILDTDHCDKILTNEQQKKRAEREFICLHSKRTFTEDVLGYGISVNRRPKTGQISKISNSMDYLSYTAFYKEGGRTSLTNEEFEFWLPLYINEEHGNRASNLVENSISLIKTGEEHLFEPLMAIDVFPKLMSSMMVEVLSQKIHASDKALCGYLCFHRWMLYFAEKYPFLLDYVNTTVNNFISDGKYRHKDVIPSLGEFLPLLTLSDLSWEDVRDSYVSENLDRNVLWVLRKSINFLRDTKDSNELNNSQIEEFFSTTALGKHLALYHVFFLKNIGREDGLSFQDIAKQYDDTYGLSSVYKKKILREFCKNVSSVTTWSAFFNGIGYKNITNSELSSILKTAILNSKVKGYHRNNIENTCKTKYCWKYRKHGYCRFGDTCKFSHDC